MVKKLYEENVDKFFKKLQDEIATWEYEQFSVQLYIASTNEKNPIESPIEQILYGAILFIARINFIENHDSIKINDEWVPLGLHILPQKNIDKYRVDFLLRYGEMFGNTHRGKDLIIECDSQKYHERDERERRYEKARDRYLIAKGYKTFHYTGSEICKNALNIAVEILAYISDREKCDFIIASNFEPYSGDGK